MGVLAVFLWLAVIMSLYARRMASRQPFSVIRRQGVEVWRLHRRVMVEWPDTPRLWINGAELQLLDDSPYGGRVLRTLLPHGGESMKLWDVTCKPSSDAVIDAVHRLCPHPVEGP